MQNVKNTFKTIKEKITRFIIVGATLGIWALFIFAAVWIIAAIGWFLLASTWLNELFIPGTIFSTFVSVLIAVIWAALLWLNAILWARYNYHHYYQNNHRSILPIIMEKQPILWQEAAIDNTCSGNYSFMPVESSCEKINIKPDHIKNNETRFNGITLKKDLKDSKGRVVIAKGETISSNIIKKISTSDLYGKFIIMLSEQSGD
jgi:hypothetical protein